MVQIELHFNLVIFRYADLLPIFMAPLQFVIGI